MQSTTFSSNPLAPTQRTTHTVTETSVTGPPQHSSQVLYQQYAHPTTHYAQPTTGPSVTQSAFQYMGTSQGTPGIQYQVGGGSNPSYGRSQLPTITQPGTSYMQDAPGGQGFHSFAKNAKGPGSSAFVSGPVPDATPMVTSGSTGTIIPRQQPYAFTTVTYAKTKSSAKEEVDPNFKNSYLNAQAESHAIRERPVHPAPAKAPAAGCC